MDPNAQDDVMEHIENIISRLERKKRNAESDETEDLEHARKVIEKDNFKKMIGEMLFIGLENKISQNTEKTAKKEEYSEVPFEKSKKLYDLEETVKSTNLINRDINAKYDAILEKLDIIADALQKAAEKKIPLTTMDEQILEFVKEKNNICAEDVQKRFDYKGKNAASTRLNNLYRKGFLKKKLINKKVYYQLQNKNELD